METKNSIVAIEQINPITVFSKGGADSIIDQIKKEIKSFVPDMTTKPGRDEIAAQAYKVSRSKTYLDECGKKLGSDYKNKIDIINNERKKFRDELDTLRDEVRKPLTEWEDKEKERVEKHKQNLLLFKELISEELIPSTSSAIKRVLERAEKITTGEEWEEFQTQAIKEKALLVDTFNERLEQRLQYEAEQAELQKLREEKAERDQEARDERIRAQAKAAAEREAEAEAARTKKAAEEREVTIKREAAEKVEKSRLQAEKAKADKKAIKEKAEKDAKEEKEKYSRVLKAVKESSELAAKAAADETERIARKKAEKEEADRLAREADEKHVREINSAISSVFIAFDLGASVEKIIDLVSRNQIPHMKITY